MKRIASFEVNHDVLERGFYPSRVDRDVFTYDLRFKKPNGGEYLDIKAMHSLEHMMATVARNSDYADKVVYFGPMGCRTGFYLLLFGTEYDEAKNFALDCLKKCLDFTVVPGSERVECGNYLEHDLVGAKREITDYLALMESK